MQQLVLVMMVDITSLQLTYGDSYHFYVESSILIATFSTFVPSSTSESHSINAEDPLSMSYTPEAFVPDYSSEWEAWRDENVIDVCEVTYTTKGSQLGKVYKPFDMFLLIISPQSLIPHLYLPFGTLEKVAI